MGQGKQLLMPLKALPTKIQVDDGPGLDEIILFITKNDTIWKRFQAEDVKNKIVLG